MASTDPSDVRLRLACDACGASSWIGPRADVVDGWCEACQRSHSPDRTSAATRCPTCGRPLTRGLPRFTEFYGELQHIEALIAAWDGDPALLGALLPERPVFLSDLTPEKPAPGDDGGTRTVLGLVLEGHYAEAQARARDRVGRGRMTPRLWTALAIAAERCGDLGAAEEAWSHVLRAGDSHRARLARGTLAARRGDHAVAARDFAAAGDGYEARWNRAALGIVEAVAVTPGLPGPERIAGARDHAPPSRGEWHEQTVGRLLWTLLVERSLARSRAGAASCPDERVLRAAEQEIEGESFWDRALIVHGYAVLGMPADVERVARPLIASLWDDLLAEPFLGGTVAAPLNAALDQVARGLREGDRAGARTRIRILMDRPDVRGYRLPCAACGKGSVGVVEMAPAAP